jgi:hypothetical protein
MKYILVAFFAIISFGVRSQVNQIGSTGNIGIGTNSPTSLLHIANGDVLLQNTSGSGYPVLWSKSANGSTTLRLDFNSILISGSVGYLRSTGMLHLNDAGGNVTIGSSTGKVGIATTTPIARLDLGELKINDLASFPAEGSITDDWGSYIVGNINGGQKLRLGVANDGNSKAEIYLENNNTPNGSISFKTAAGGAATTKMHIDANGRVGIGTTSYGSGYKLYVEEGIRTRKVKVDIQSWADHVFHPSYSLRPLSEVEKYIKEHKHLPEVPSAQQVLNEGLDLGDNQAALLKKIEELTLYVIQQQKEIEKLKETVNRKQKRDRK